MSLLSVFQRFRDRRAAPARRKTSGPPATTEGPALDDPASESVLPDAQRELQALDVALSSRHIVDNDEHRLSNDEYWQWRKRAMMRRGALAKQEATSPEAPPKAD